MRPDKGRLPKFSVIVTCFNYEAFVRQAVESVAAQTYENFECIIVDDASKDSSAAVIQEYLYTLKDSRFRFIQLEENIGQTEAGIVGLNEATGEFVAFLDADDWWSQDFIALHLTAHLSQHGHVGFSCCDMLMVDTHGNQISGTMWGFAKGRMVGRRSPSAHKMKVLLGSKSMAKTPPVNFYLYQQSMTAAWYFTPTSGMVFRRALLTRLRPPTRSQAGRRVKNIDYIYAMIASTLTGWIAIESPAAAYRLHGSNIMANNAMTGGAYWMTGEWNLGDRKRMYAHIEQTILRNYPHLKPLYSHWIIMSALLKLGVVSFLRCWSKVIWKTLIYLATENMRSKQG